MSKIDEYLAGVDPPQRAELERVREVIKQTVPEAEDVITYGMPGFKYQKKYLIAYAAFKDHLSVFPGSEPVASMEDKLSGFKRSKGTIQFTLDNPLPESIIRELVKLRVSDIDK